jgi:hypothetical protein
MIQKYVPIRGMTPTIGDGEYVKCEDYEKLKIEMLQEWEAKGILLEENTELKKENKKLKKEIEALKEYKFMYEDLCK